MVPNHVHRLGASGQYRQGGDGRVDAMPAARTLDELWATTG
jgi:hypothetical protein